MEYNISAMVVYEDTIEADSKDEAIDSFIYNCPYDVDRVSIHVVEDDSTKEGN